MPYVNGKRVSQQEWIALNGHTILLHTGPNGENPASGPDIDADTGVPKPKPKAGGNRSQRSAKAAKAAIADALGVKEDSHVLDDIDVSGLDAPTWSEEDDS
jgi:hypothetical protein